MKNLSQHIYYRNNFLWIENVNITKINFQTPYYCYTYHGIIDNCKKLKQYMPNVEIFYAIKANPNLSIIKVIAGQGFGADVVSEGEMKRAMTAGIKKIIFSGVGKTSKEIEFALKNNVHQINAESIPELELISKIAKNLNLNPPLGIRINLDIEGKTHDKISTSRKKDKFGITIEDLDKALTSNIMSLSIHIGSQISNLEVFSKAFYKLKDIIKKYSINKITRLDLGGGFPIPYKNNEKEFDYKGYYSLIQKFFHNYNVMIEPGRALVGNTGILVSKVLFTKRTKENTHIIIDAGMNDLMRPALYGAYHEVIPIIKTEKDKIEVVDICGPICESSDILAKQRKISTLHEGDLIGICTAGAYGSSMSNNYNSRPLIPEILIKKNQEYIIRYRECYNETLSNEKTDAFGLI